jgi:hypothetical protein
LINPSTTPAMNVATVAIGQTPGTMLTTRVPRISCDWAGVVGDLHAGVQRKADARVPWYPRGTPMRNERQVSMVSSEELAATAVLLGVPEIQPEWLGANIMVSGWPQFTALPPTTRLVFGSGAVLVVWNENLPCRSPGELIQTHYPAKPGLAGQYPKHALHRRGLVGVVEIPGPIAAGDTVAVHLPRDLAWTAPDAPWRAG